MIGTKKRNKKLALDLGKVNHFLEVNIESNYFNMSNFSPLKFMFLISHFQRENKKE